MEDLFGLFFVLLLCSIIGGIFILSFAMVGKMFLILWGLI